MNIIINLNNELEKYNLTEERYKCVLNDIDAKLNGENDLDWSEIIDKYSIKCNPDTLRKASTTPFGGKIRSDYCKENIDKEKSYSYKDELDLKIEELRKERIKLQTSNVERNRIDRAEARQEYYYEQIGSICNTIPVPTFNEIPCSKNNTEYVVSLTDIHYGAEFVSANNQYSKEIAVERFEYLVNKLVEFINDKKLTCIKIVNGGDSLQGLLRVSDLKLNESSVVKSTVEISHIIASMLNTLSKYTNVEYYHSPTANHTQTRPLGTKASEISDEDLEFIISHYIEDLCSNNSRIKVFTADEGKQYIKVNINGYNCLAMHGHQIKNIENSLMDMSMQCDEMIDYLLLGHFHSGKEIPVQEKCTYDAEVLIGSSFVGSDPYSDSIMKGSKASVKIYGFDEIYGHTESYKIILN